MKFISYWQNHFSSVGFFSSSPIHREVIELPNFPELISLEEILWLLVFIFLISPLLREQKNPALEKQRIGLLKLTAILGGLALVIHFYRIASVTY